MSSRQFYADVTVPAAFDGAGQIADVGFVANHWRFFLQSNGPVEYSFNGVDVHGMLGPSGTRPMEVEDHVNCSRVWFRGASTPVVSVWASIS